jgi:hypothetical protein
VAGHLPQNAANVDDMLRVAERRAKVSDWGPTSFREGLELLVKGFNEDDQLHPLGRKLIYDGYADRLVQRLQVVQALAEQPTIAEQEVTSPVLIGGLPRTGTTHDVRDFGLDEEVIRRRLRAYMDISRTWT